MLTTNGRIRGGLGDGYDDLFFCSCSTVNVRWIKTVSELRVICSNSEPKASNRDGIQRLECSTRDVQDTKIVVVRRLVMQGSV